MSVIYIDDCFYTHAGQPFLRTAFTLHCHTSKSSTKTFISVSHYDRNSKIRVFSQNKINTCLRGCGVFYCATIVSLINGGGDPLDDFCMGRPSKFYLLGTFNPICVLALNRPKPNECSHARALRNVLDVRMFFNGK